MILKGLVTEPHCLILQALEEDGRRLVDEPGPTLIDVFEAANKHLRLMACEESMEVNAMESGCCGVVMFVHGRELWVAGAGDCRAVVGTRKAGVSSADDETGGGIERKDGTGEVGAMQLSMDHKVNLVAEEERITAAGGWVRPPVNDPVNDVFTPARMYEDRNQPWRGPGLCVSRAIGDLNASACGLIPRPHIFSHEVGDADLFVILASDGVWEFIENDEAAQIVYNFYKQGKPALDACRFLIAKAAVCWRLYEGDYRDDITAIVVYLQVRLACIRRPVEPLDRRLSHRPPPRCS